MGLHTRKLLTSSCEYKCYVKQYCSTNCDDCLSKCYSPPSPLETDQTKHHKVSTYLIISIAIAVAAFFVFFCYAIYARFFSGWNRSRRRRASSSSPQQTQDDFVDEEHGPVVDHPIWYIRTTGLQQSIISAITVCKYKKGEGLIEGTDCSVCLSEFQEDEDLRLLPKCNHAFHLPCIDTWLRSHTNCPLCRAPIVTNPARIPSMEPNAFDSSSVENNTQMEVLENSGETSDPQLRNGEEEQGQQVEDGRSVCETESSAAEVVNTQPRRSVSLDSSSAAKITLALATVLSVESHGEVNEQVVSRRVAGNENLATVAKGSSSSRTRNLLSAPSSMKRSRSFNGKHLLSCYSGSQKKPNAPLRSF